MARPPSSSPPAQLGEAALLRALRDGDERAFEALVDAYTPSMLRLARSYVPSQALAEEVVQEGWLGVLRGLDRFEGRASLKTWIFRIVANTAMARGVRERRSVPFSALAPDGDVHAPSVDPDRFFPSDRSRHPGHWSLGPTPWQLPEEGLLAGETRDVIRRAIDDLPASQRAVVTLRDIEGWPPEEVCEALELTDANQRVLLHRGRTKVRGALERYFAAVEPVTPEGRPRTTVG